jgi:hypothetical protein
MADVRADPIQHPVKAFVPKNVLDNMAVLYMAPSSE